MSDGGPGPTGEHRVARHAAPDGSSRLTRGGRGIVRILRWGVLDLDAGIAARMWFAALFGPLLVIAGLARVAATPSDPPWVLIGGLVLTGIGWSFVVATSVHRARARVPRARP